MGFIMYFVAAMVFIEIISYMECKYETITINENTIEDLIRHETYSIGMNVCEIMKED